ncbi:MAG: GNAT family N-acetyltransferase [Actinobacteria bacterium]|nr:GNAT family N-acetyltransferase [Actinomycetota bacterium]
MVGERDVRRATVDDAGAVARLLHDFNTEYDVETPGPTVLAERLTTLLAGPHTLAILAGGPPVGVALVTLRPNVWFAGPVALLDELYVVPAERGAGIGSAIIRHLLAAMAVTGVERVEINVDEEDFDARRFYERHGFSATDPDTGEGALSYSRSVVADG